VRAKASSSTGLGVTLGGTLLAAKGANVNLTIDITPAQAANFNGDLPKLAKVDVIQGLITGEPADKDTFTAPNTRLVKTFDVTGKTAKFRLVLTFKRVTDSFYLRLRGSDGNRLGEGYFAGQDPEGPRMDVIGDADPWKDLWFYSNPIFVSVQ